MQGRGYSGTTVKKVLALRGSDQLCEVLLLLSPVRWAGGSRESWTRAGPEAEARTVFQSTEGRRPGEELKMVSIHNSFEDFCSKDKCSSR